MTRANTAMAGTMASSAASEPGQVAPAPSAPQKVPNAVSITPTTNFKVFSGTLASGARIASPARPTRTTAETAATAASGMSCALPPKVSAMKTTSSPSSSTPLNESVKPYQSGTSPARRAGSAAAAATCSR